MSRLRLCRRNSRRNRRVETEACAGSDVDLNPELWRIEGAVRRQVETLKRVPEHMDPRLYYKTFRPYIRFFERVAYEAADAAPMQFRGETGAQSSIMPTLITFMKIAHRRSILTDHLDDMRTYSARTSRPYQGGHGPARYCLPGAQGGVQRHTGRHGFVPSRPLRLG
jgi:hypothetical protein